MASFAVDQFGVVWFEGGLMSRECYEEHQRLDPALVPYEQLPQCNAYDQNMIEIDDQT